MIIETYIVLAGIGALALAFLGTRVETRPFEATPSQAAKAA